MKAYYTAAARKLLDFKEAHYIPPSERRFNVRINGVDVAHSLKIGDAQRMMEARARPSFCQIYLDTRPLKGRRAAWHKQPLPRPATLHTSEVSRAKAMANVRADREISVSFETATHSEAVFATGAL